MGIEQENQEDQESEDKNLVMSCETTQLQEALEWNQFPWLQSNGNYDQWVLKDVYPRKKHLLCAVDKKKRRQWEWTRKIGKRQMHIIIDHRSERPFDCRICQGCTTRLHPFQDFMPTYALNYLIGSIMSWSDTSAPDTATDCKCILKIGCTRYFTVLKYSSEPALLYTAVRKLKLRQLKQTPACQLAF